MRTFTKQQWAKEQYTDVWTSLRNPEHVGKKTFMTMDESGATVLLIEDLHFKII